MIDNTTTTAEIPVGACWTEGGGQDRVQEEEGRAPAVQEADGAYALEKLYDYHACWISERDDCKYLVSVLYTAVCRRNILLDEHCLASAFLMQGGVDLNRSFPPVALHILPHLLSLDVWHLVLL